MNFMYIFFSVDDGFYNINLMMIGKTYIRMKNNSQALKYLVRARDYNVKSADDEEVSVLP